VCIGLGLAQGLFYGLRQLLTGLLMAFWGGSGDDIWNGVHGVLMIQAVQVVSLLLGGLLTGGGQRHGLFLGAVVGLWYGVLTTLLGQNPAPSLTVVSAYGPPMLHAAVAALSGWVGSLIWKPVPAAHLPGLPLVKRKANRPRPSIFAGKVAWFRVLLGVSLAVGGTLWAALLFDKMLEVGAGKLGTTDDIQDLIITWEIKALAMLVGGALAGATTANGIKQGLFVGMLTCLTLITLETRRHQVQWLEIAALTLVSSFTLAVVGGWFGSQLFPPIIKFKPPRGSLGSLTNG
jgi:hypothetical protein